MVNVESVVCVVSITVEYVVSIVSMASEESVVSTNYGEW